MAKAGAKRRPAKLKISNTVSATTTDLDGFRIDVDIEEAQRAADRVRAWLLALRGRHADLARFEYTRHVRIVPASTTHSHPILTLGTRFAESEDHLLATYLHEQMHWYLWRLGGPDHDPVAPFFDELVRRYPKAPTRLPDGARNYEQTYVHLVVCWLELNAASEFIGWDRAAALAETNYGYRWIYRTVVRDWEALGALYTKHGILPMRTADEMAKGGALKLTSKRAAKPATKPAVKSRAAAKKTPAAKAVTPSRTAPRKPRARGGKSAG
jgi:hypothetical protein